MNIEEWRKNYLRSLKNEENKIVMMVTHCEGGAQKPPKIDYVILELPHNWIINYWLKMSNDSFSYSYTKSQDNIVCTVLKCRKQNYLKYISNHDQLFVTSMYAGLWLAHAMSPQSSRVPTKTLWANPESSVTYRRTDNPSIIYTSE